MLFGKNKNETPPVAAAPISSGLAIFDATDADFEQNVLVASMERPIIVDFWAPWCGPCKQLTPILEKAVLATNGAIALAKVDVDANQGIATALRIQSIPAVYAFFQGRPIDGFQGAVPESHIKAFIDKLLLLANQAAPDAIDIPETLKAAAALITEKKFTDAQQLYALVLHQDKNNAPAYVGLVRALIAGGDIEQAKHLVDNAPPEITKASIFNEARTALELAQVKPQGSSEALAQKLAANPVDHQTRYELAIAEFAEGKKEEGMDNLLHLIRRKRDWNENAARLQLLKFFEALGPADPLTLQGRRKLSSILFS